MPYRPQDESSKIIVQMLLADYSPTEIFERIKLFEMDQAAKDELRHFAEDWVRERG